MSSDAEKIANLKKSVGRLSLLLLAMEDLVASLVESARRNGALDDDALESIKVSCINSLKNMEASGVAINDEAEIFRKALSDLDHLIDRAFQSAREGRT